MFPRHDHAEFLRTSDIDDVVVSNSCLEHSVHGIAMTDNAVTESRTARARFHRHASSGLSNGDGGLGWDKIKHQTSKLDNIYRW